jgi:hypothetical protein
MANYALFIQTFDIATVLRTYFITYNASINTVLTLGYGFGTWFRIHMDPYRMDLHFNFRKIPFFTNFYFFRRNIWISL